jgi:hypothetical protein
MRRFSPRRMPVRKSILALALLVAATTLAAAEPAKPLFGSIRLRLDEWNFFDTATGKGRYMFGASQIRLGVRKTLAGTDALLEIEQPALFNLPRAAVAPSPAGQLGLGASYYSANGTTTHPAGIFVKQLTIGRQRPGLAWRLGRFEYSDATERIPANPIIAVLMRERIAQRLVGPFGFSHVGRSFDGGQLSVGNATLMALRPTTGAYQVHGGSELAIDMAYASYILPEKTSDSRFFALEFRDRRDVVKVDNRPLTVRQGDTGNIDVVTIGGNRVETFGRFDVVGWANAQFGRWGAQRQRANAFDVEGGWHGPVTVRAGYYRSSGDRDPADGTHGTWFPGVPTSRSYARFPLYNSMNSRDLFVQFAAKPRPAMTLAFEAHRLGLTSSRDLWYSGGGAFDEKVFGVNGRPASGHDDLLNVIDANVEWKVNSLTTVTFYAAHAHGGAVVTAIFQGGSANYVHLEVLRRF